MKKILFPDMHTRMPKALAMALIKDNWQILLPDHSFNDHIGYYRKWSNEEIKDDVYIKNILNIKSTSFQETLENPPEIIIITCYEVYVDILKIYNKMDKTKTKLVYYQGNNHFAYNWDTVTNLITTDENTFYKARLRNKNVLFYLPWVDFENDYKFESINNSKNIFSYIEKYKEWFPEAYNIANNCKKIFNELEYNVEYLNSVPVTNIPSYMNNSFITLHVKPLEGYGFAIIESMAKGRPVVLYKPYAEAKTYNRWAFDMETCIFFDSLEELKEKFLIYAKNYDNIQLKCSQKIRQIIKNEKQNNSIIQYLNNII